MSNQLKLAVLGIMNVLTTVLVKIPNASIHVREIHVLLWLLALLPIIELFAHVRTVTSVPLKLNADLVSFICYCF